MPWLQRWAVSISEVEQAAAVSALKPLPLSKYLPFLPEVMRKTVIADHLQDFDGLQKCLSSGIEIMLDTSQNLSLKKGV